MKTTLTCFISNTPEVTPQHRFHSAPESKAFCLFSNLQVKGSSHSILLAHNFSKNFLICIVTGDIRPRVIESSCYTYYHSLGGIQPFISQFIEVKYQGILNKVPPCSQNLLLINMLLTSKDFFSITIVFFSNIGVKPLYLFCMTVK